MATRANGVGGGPVRPVDLSKLLERLELGIGQAAHLCGISIRQICYWTDKGIIPLKDDGDCEEPGERRSTRCYGYAAIQKICLIKQALDQGYSLEGATVEAEAFLERQARERERLSGLETSDLRRLIEARADRLLQFSDRIRRGLRTYRVSGDLGRMAASLTGLEKLIAFLEASPYTVNTARQIALRVGQEADVVQKELDLLEERRFIQKIRYPGADVYRYIPPRRQPPSRWAR